MPTFEIPTCPPIAESGRASFASEPRVRRGERAAVKPLYGSITYDRQKGEMPFEWDNKNTFLAWLAAEERDKAIKFIVSSTRKSNSPNWRERHVYRCSREFSGGKWDPEDKSQFKHKIAPMKTGCQCRVTIKMYPHTDTILGKCEGDHDHTLGDDNLRFLRLTERTKISVMDMVCKGMDSKAILKVVRDSCERTDRDYYITMRDVNRLRRIVEDDEIRLDDNDVISVKLWVTKLRHTIVKLRQTTLSSPPSSLHHYGPLTVCRVVTALVVLVVGAVETVVGAVETVVGAVETTVAAVTAVVVAVVAVIVAIVVAIVVVESLGVARRLAIAPAAGVIAIVGGAAAVTSGTCVGPALAALSHSHMCSRAAPSCTRYQPPPPPGLCHRQQQDNIDDNDNEHDNDSDNGDNDKAAQDGVIGNNNNNDSEGKDDDSDTKNNGKTISTTTMRHNDSDATTRSSATTGIILMRSR
ncbi:hypothetical protein EDB85DRAFT_2157411 [Lactarius pseudohatsudake]|nr:hypothetical protein EDB85DRAFT_2157411 [Lactarius pseudohatsudake]